jgi:hypothetical protein
MENKAHDVKENMKKFIDGLKGMTNTIPDMLTSLMDKLPPQEKVEVAKILKSKDVEGHVKKATSGLEDIEKLFDLK